MVPYKEADVKLLLPVAIHRTTALRDIKKLTTATWWTLPRILRRQRKAFVPLSVKDPGESAGSEWASEIGFNRILHPRRAVRGEHPSCDGCMWKPVPDQPPRPPATSVCILHQDEGGAFISVAEQCP